MTTRSFKLLPALAVLGFAACLAFSSPSRADDLVLGSPGAPYIQLGIGPDKGDYVQGGNIPNSTLNTTTSLPWVYCVDIYDGVNVPGTYNTTTLTHTGFVNGALVGGSTQTADEISYLLLKYGKADVGTLEGALQAAVWTLEYGAGTVTDIATENGNSASGHHLDLMNSYVTEAQNAYAGGSAVGDRTLLTWMSPDSSLAPGTYQGLVTLVTPEPSSMAIAVLGVLGMLMYLRRRKIV